MQPNYTTKKRQALKYWQGWSFRFISMMATAFSIFLLLWILSSIAVDGWSYISWNFLKNTSSRFPDQAGIFPALVGSILTLLIASAVSIPLGMGTAIYLEEYAKKNIFTSFLRLNVRNLAGVPSIVYGILGVTLFVRVLDLGRSILAGGLTMAFLMLPIITIASQEALRGVPREIRRAGYSVGLTQWRVIYHLVLPAALPGFLTGMILSISRVIGEASPLILVGAVAYITFLPTSPFDQFTVLPIQIFNWAGKAIKEFHGLSAAASMLLMLLLFLLNGLAIRIRAKHRNLGRFQS